MLVGSYVGGGALGIMGSYVGGGGIGGGAVRAFATGAGVGVGVGVGNCVGEIELCEDSDDAVGVWGASVGMSGRL